MVFSGVESGLAVQLGGPEVTGGRGPPGCGQNGVRKPEQGSGVTAPSGPELVEFVAQLGPR